MPQFILFSRNLPSVLSNFRSISKLLFLSKILEKIVSVQLVSFMNRNQIFEIFQSGFHAFHSTETALVRILNDLLLAGDADFYSVLILLDLTSTFNTIDHNVLINHLMLASAIGCWTGLSHT
ncbi:hypothetical protein LDENG_00224490 [Lucifuga dentata]|nr:hypothetical protein LDENG_00224490 [Lucifuga dentata]